MSENDFNETVVRHIAQCITMCTLADEDGPMPVELRFERDLAASLDSPTTCDITYALLLSRIETCLDSSHFTQSQRESIIGKVIYIIVSNIREIPPSKYNKFCFLHYNNL